MTPLTIQRGGPVTIDAYISHHALGGARTATLALRRTCLEAFARRLEPRRIEEATRRDVESYLARPLKPESRRTYRSCLVSFFAWLMDEDIIDTDPMEKVPNIRVPRGVPRPVSAPDVAVALSLASPRMRAWLSLMALAGLRAMEVAALRPRDVIPAETGPLLYLQEVKGGGTATVPAHPAVIEALAVLPITGGLWWSVSPNQVSRDVAAFLRSTGLDATGHQLRHYAATSWLRASGHDLLAVSVLLRHRDVSSSQRYAQLDPVRPAQVVAATPAP